MENTLHLNSCDALPCIWCLLPFPFYILLPYVHICKVFVSYFPVQIGPEVTFFEI